MKLDYATGVCMRQHKDFTFIEANTNSPNDSSLEQMKLSVPKSQTDKSYGISPSKTAKFLLKSRALRSEQFRDITSGIDDVSWHILLDLVAAKSACKPITVHGLAITHNMPMSTMSRYVDYLVGVGLIIKSVDAQDDEQVLLKLTAYGDIRTSNALENIGRELAGF
ncbi:MarR family winged helix-turn-helix transcriptional regulator [Parasphingorhabdus sp.]|uniref:MarR family winged helix-turn-helix transcriptional regulator n=1 Tax=Parasphingorhabdus sp. TaxID=2709688 RepID=UPI0030010B59